MFTTFDYVVDEAKINKKVEVQSLETSEYYFGEVQSALDK